MKRITLRAAAAKIGVNPKTLRELMRQNRLTCPISAGFPETFNEGMILPKPADHYDNLPSIRELSLSPYIKVEDTITMDDKL